MGRLTYNKDKQKFYFEVHNINEREQAQDAGFVFDIPTLQWATRKINKAIKFRPFADASAEIKFKNTFITHHARPEQLNYPDYRLPHTFQVESAFHALTRSPSYIADEAGLGKTITAIMCMNTKPGKTLIVCPPYLKYNWQDEVLKWTTEHTNILILESGNNLENYKPPHRETVAVIDVTIVPDSLITNESVRAFLGKQHFEWIFIDEAHRFKEESAARTQALLPVEDSKFDFAITDLAKRVVFMSGTPMPQRPFELWPILGSVAPSVFEMDRTEFGRHFGGGTKTKVYMGPYQPPKIVYDYKGVSNLDFLRKRLFKSFMIRHLKEECLTELPPKNRKFIFLNGSKKLYALEKKALANRSLEDLIGKENYNLGDIATYRAQAGLEIARQSIEYIKDVLDANPKEKVLIFAHHISTIKLLESELSTYGVLTIQGGMSARAKTTCVEMFQTMDMPRVIVGNIDAMGVGFTLTRAKKVIFVEHSWVPGINEQAEDRAHRIGQTDIVDVVYLVLRGEFGEPMLSKVLGKAETVNAVFGRKKNKNGKHNFSKHPKPISKNSTSNC